MHWHYLLMLAATTHPPAAKITFDGIPFGERKVITGLWFTNFENSRFLVCDSPSCDERSLEDWSSVECQPDVCAELQVAARQAAHQWDLKQPPSGEFKVRFEGRVSPIKYPSRYLGDGQGRVLIERLLDVMLPKSAPK